VCLLIALIFHNAVRELHATAASKQTAMAVALPCAASTLAAALKQFGDKSCQRLSLFQCRIGAAAPNDH
jgi:hypothetical protein